MRTTWKPFSNKTKQLTFLLALTFLFLFSGSVFGQEEVNGGDETVRSYSKSGKLVTEIHYKNDKKDGLYKQWYENGRKEYLKHYKNDVLDGMVAEWYPSGKKKSTSHYKNGIENGFRKEWDEDGQLIFQGNFVDGNEKIK